MLDKTLHYAVIVGETDYAHRESILILLLVDTYAIAETNFQPEFCITPNICSIQFFNTLNSTSHQIWKVQVL